MTYVTTTHSWTTGVTCSVTSMNSNFADIVAGVNDGTKELNLNSISCTCLSVSGMLYGAEASVRFTGAGEFDAGFIPTVKIYINSSYVETAGAIYDRGDVPVSKGDRIDLKAKDASVARTWVVLSPGECVYSNEDSIGFTMPRSGCITRAALYAYDYLSSGIYATETRVTVVFALDS
jgi:hypothetical protein